MAPPAGSIRWVAGPPQNTGSGCPVCGPRLSREDLFGVVDDIPRHRRHVGLFGTGGGERCVQVPERSRRLCAIGGADNVSGGERAGRFPPALLRSGSPWGPRASAPTADSKPLRSPGRCSLLDATPTVLDRVRQRSVLGDAHCGVIWWHVCLPVLRVLALEPVNDCATTRPSISSLAVDARYLPRDDLDNAPRRPSTATADRGVAQRTAE